MKDLEQAAKDLEKTRDMARASSKCSSRWKDQQDLAGQLKNRKTEAEAAQASLQKMIDQLKKSNLSKEQMDKMMSDVSKAIDPGSKYGKVGDYLKWRLYKMKQGRMERASVARIGVKGTRRPDGNKCRTATRCWRN